MKINTKKRNLVANRTLLRRGAEFCGTVPFHTHLTQLCRIWTRSGLIGDYSFSVEDSYDVLSGPQLRTLDI